MNQTPPYITLRPYLIAFALYFALALIVTWPAALDLSGELVRAGTEDQSGSRAVGAGQNGDGDGLDPTDRVGQQVADRELGRWDL